MVCVSKFTAKLVLCFGMNVIYDQKGKELRCFGMNLIYDQEEKKLR